jgi:HlyD family secretion protein
LKLKWKVILGIVLLAVLGAGAFAAFRYSKRGIVPVQTGRVVRQDLVSLVTASGEIKPRNYVNIDANAIPRITQILVKEGDHVHKGQLLAKLESIQPQADVSAQKARIQGPRNRDRKHGDPSLHGPGGLAEHDIEPGGAAY